MKDIVIYIAFAIELLFIGYLFYCAYENNRTPMYKPKKDKRRKTMIEELESYEIKDEYGMVYGKSVPNNVELKDKINEIIRYLNEKEKNDGNGTVHP